MPEQQCLFESVQGKPVRFHSTAADQCSSWLMQEHLRVDSVSSRDLGQFSSTSSCQVHREVVKIFVLYSPILVPCFMSPRPASIHSQLPAKAAMRTFRLPSSIYRALG